MATCRPRMQAMACDLLENNCEMDAIITILEKMLDACTLRHGILANNLANTQTPDYKRQDISFRKDLAEAIRSGNANDLKQIAHQIEVDKTSPAGRNGNSVSTHKELGLMLENTTLYNTAAEALSRKMATIRKAIQ